MSCLPNSTRAACPTAQEPPAQQHKSNLRAARPTAQELLQSRFQAAPRQQTRAQARAGPKQLRSTTKHSKIARERRADPQSAFEATHGRFASTLARWIAADTAAGVFLSLGRVLSAPTL